MRSPRTSIICVAIVLVALSTTRPDVLNVQASQTENAAEKQMSVARLWTGALLFAIRRDLARPTVHSRNLYHLSAAMFDVWSLYQRDRALPVFIGNDSAIDECKISKQDYALIDQSARGRDNAVEQAISSAAWHLLSHRFAHSRNSEKIQRHINAIALSQGIDVLDSEFLALQQAQPVALGNPLAVGRKVARCLIASGLDDGANEQDNYANIDYISVNPPLSPLKRGNKGVFDPNRWQPLLLNEFIDQSGNLTDTPDFLGANWGQVKPFALEATDQKKVINRRRQMSLWLDPGMPPQLTENTETSRQFQHDHAQVVQWSGQLSPNTGERIDISPAAHTTNPVTGEPYAKNMVLQGDYTRIVAEYWADGPESETPPGHWFSLYNEMVVTHPLHITRVAGQGEPVSALEYDVFAYLALGGALHDAAIAAWSIKRHYDTSRPITAIRYMAWLGQSTDKDAENYHPQGIPLIDGVIETVRAGDPLAGKNNRFAGRIKARAWRGPSYSESSASGTAGVGWILLENWWPYQRPTFVSPPFAGYVSGHSSFSQAAARILTELTGSAFFPGGIAEFTAYRNEFLGFEKGPSKDVTLQWATYQDAADQSGLSRIWGGIHPMADHVAGQKIGKTVGDKAWRKALNHYPGRKQHQ